MKNIYTIASIILLILAALIINIGLKLDAIINPPVISGVGFIVIAIVVFTLRKR